MAIFDRITDAQAELIAGSWLFRIASVHPEAELGPVGEGPVNLSPKGMTPLQVLGPNRVAYLDHPGNGNETARYADAGGPVTLMVMSMTSRDAAIVRLYGKARVTPLAESPLADVLRHGAPSADKTRQVVEVLVDRTQTSCGYGVPVFEFRGPRTREGRDVRFRG